MLPGLNHEAAAPRVRGARAHHADPASVADRLETPPRRAVGRGAASGSRWRARCWLSPRLLLADRADRQPLDTKTGREKHALFFELNRELALTILISTHNNELAAQTARKLRMADGVSSKGSSEDRDDHGWGPAAVPRTGAPWRRPCGSRPWADVDNACWPGLPRRPGSSAVAGGARPRARRR